MHWVSLALAIAASMIGQTLLKAGAGASGLVAQLFDWRTILGLGVYFASALLYILALRRISEVTSLMGTL